MTFTARFFPVLLLSPLLAFGAIEDYFKKAENKSDIHKIKNVDFIYMINMDRRPERWESSNRQLNPYGIFPYRFSAVNGWELSLEAIHDVGLKFNKDMIGGYLGTTYRLEDNFESYHSIIENEGQSYFCHCMARGTIGILLSHLSVLRDALDSKYETIWVMEDDIEVLSDPSQISDLIEKLDRLVGKNGWDVLFTDRNIRGWNGEDIPAYGMAKRPNFNPKDTSQYYINQRVSSDFIRIGARFGATSIILRRSGIKKIYDFIISHSFFHPYDMDFYLPKGIKIYTVAKNIVSNMTRGSSDNGSPNYLH
jgi:GR25 family glycosyltransferase involved in LPS biosynthesis